MRHNASTFWSWLWLAGLIAVISLHFWFPRYSQQPLNDTYSTERAGKKAFYLLAQRRFVEARRNDLSPASAVKEMYDDDVFCLLGPSRQPDQREWKVFLDWVEQGGSLIIAPAYGDPSLKIEELGLQVEPLFDFDLNLGEMLEQAQEQKQEEETQPVQTTLFGGGEVRWRSTGKITGDGGEVIVEFDDAPQAVLKPYGSGRVLLIASDDIFSNGSLAYKDNGILAQRLVASVSSPESHVIFDEYYNSIGAPKVVGLLFDPLLRPLTVQMLALLLLFVWYGSRRFGRQLPALYQPRHNIVDHTDALGNMYYRTGDGRMALRDYYEQLRKDLQFRHMSLSDNQAVETLARRADQEPQQVRELLARANSAINGPKLKRRAAAEIIRDLATLRAGILRKQSALAKS
ncbi:DUF4350 domain-containing protein [Symmachiella dynata]|uniref:DUF4350 domain-containing protein n=1 Tax=Symmachiella dynata TaxID=2527995 RepID=UPI0030EFA187